MKKFERFKGKLLSLVLYGLLFPAFLSAQVSLQWARFYNGPAPGSKDQVVDMVTDSSGNVYVTGTSNGTNNRPDYATIKYSSAGAQQWVARYNSDFNKDDVATAMTIDNLGNIYVTGFSEGIGPGGDFATIKYNNSGVQQWVARYNGPADNWDQAMDIVVDPDGNVYVTGWASGVDGPSFATVKYNSAGTQLWVMLYDGPASNGADIPTAIALDPVTRDVYVTGVSPSSPNSSCDYVTIKYSTAGVQKWVQRYFGPQNIASAGGRAIALDSLGNVYVSGVNASANGNLDYLTIKYSATGIQEWTARFDGQGYDEMIAMVVDPLGNVYVSGFSENLDEELVQMTTIKYNEAGVQQWIQRYHNPVNQSSDRVNAMTLDLKGNIYVTGYTRYPNSPTYVDYLTLKYNPAGVLHWAERYDAFNSVDYPTAIAVNKFNDVYVGGSVRKYSSIITNDDYDYSTIKYTQPPPLTINAGNDKTQYYGYGSICLMLHATVSGGTGPYTYSWSPGGNTPNGQTTTVCSTTTTTYTVIVTDANQNMATDQVVVNVVDVRCGNNNNKVMVCHKGQTLCIASNAVLAHLAHGDYLGSCSNVITTFRQTEYERSDSLRFRAFPNPFKDQITINYALHSDGKVTIKLYDMVGREVRTVINENRKAGFYTSVLNKGNLVQGTYYCRIVASSRASNFTKTIKMVLIQ